jgi:hypothetical protein
MIYYKEECKRLVSSKAAILLLDDYTENGTPVFVTRKVTGMSGGKCGPNSEWCVGFDKALSDGCIHVVPKFILGVNTGDTLDISPLTDFLHKKHSYLPIQERLMLIGDARVRLKDAKK